MTTTPKQAVVLAAGFGKRMMPLTETCPKPLLHVGGRPILDWIFDALVDAGVEDVVVNTHYLPEQIEEFCNARHDLNTSISFEEEILETGGGVRNVLPRLKNEPFYVLNGDVIWEDFPGDTPAMQGIAERWDDETMDLLLMLYPKAKLPKDSPLAGDYQMSETGELTHQRGGAYMFTGPRIVHPRLFENTEEGAFSFLDLFHKAQARNRLYGYVLEGAWHHVGTPEELHQVNEIYQMAQKESVS